MEIHAVKLSFDNILTMQEHLLIYLPSNKRDKIKKYHHPEDYFRSLVADLLSRLVLCKLIGITNTEFTLKLTTNANGKPYLQAAPCHYNLSHSGEWVVLIVDEMPVGIDIEQIRSIDMEIAKRFFSSAEYDKISAMPSNQQLAFFYSMWTLKEAIIKADGRGLSIPLDSFSILIENDRIHLDRGSSSIQPSFLRQYDIDSTYSLSVCAMRNNFPLEVNIWNLESFATATKNSLDALTSNYSKRKI